MKLNDLNKDIRRLLLAHWTAAEIDDRLSDPEYFFAQVVIPRLEYLKRSGEETPVLRMAKTRDGDVRVFLNS